MATLVDRVTVEARRLDPARAAAATGRGVLRAVTFVLYGLGWLAARIIRVAWAVFVVVVWPALAWSVAAVKLGWQEGWRPPGRAG